MKCKNKEVRVSGFCYNDVTDMIQPTMLRCIITNDEIGKTLSIDNGIQQFTIPVEPIMKYLEGDYRNVYSN